MRTYTRIYVTTCRVLIFFPTDLETTVGDEESRGAELTSFDFAFRPSWVTAILSARLKISINVHDGRGRAKTNPPISLGFP